MKGKELKCLEGLANALGMQLEGEISLYVFDVLKAAAETIGCSVAEDGTTNLIDHEHDMDPEIEDVDEDELNEPDAKRLKQVTESDSGANDSGSGGDDDGSGSESRGEEEEDGSSGEEDEEEQEELLFTDPVAVEDPRSSEKSPKWGAISSAEDLMAWMVAPLTLPDFFETVLERQPLLITRGRNRQYYAGLFSKRDVDSLLRTPQGMLYSLNVDVTNFKDGKRLNFNYNEDSPAKKEEEGSAAAAGSKKKVVADPAVVWRRYAEGCSVRLLHPQRFSDPLWHLLAPLEAFWGSCVGCNTYLTPAGAQGFAPHWDDIDACVLQLEGSKRWKVHAPTSPHNVLPRFSSLDFSGDELGPVVLDAVLQPGDFLYLPRGCVHQAQSTPDSHSLHLTVSLNQQRTWRDLLEITLPRALALAAQDHRVLRESVPRELGFALGSALLPLGDDAAEEAREAAKDALLMTASQCMEAVMASMDLDWAADQWGAQFMERRLPPVILPSRAGNKNKVEKKAKKLKEQSVVGPAMPGVARLVVDPDVNSPEGAALVYHCVSNSRSLHAERGGDDDAAEEEGNEEGDVSVLQFEIGCAATLAELLAAEDGVPVGEVAAPEEEGCEVSAVEVAQALLDAGLLRRM